MGIRIFFFVVVGVGLGLAGCTRFPDLDQTVTPAAMSAQYPPLVPLDPLLAQANTDGQDPAATQNNINARVARLRARAARLRGSVHSGSTRQRLARGLH